jgi:hypothetical protein
MHEKLSKIDSFFQNWPDKMVQRQWENICRIYYVDDLGKGWEGVYRSQPTNVKIAYSEATTMCLRLGFEIDDIVETHYWLDAEDYYNKHVKNKK